MTFRTWRFASSGDGLMIGKVNALDEQAEEFKVAQADTPLAILWSNLHLCFSSATLRRPSLTSNFRDND